MTASGARRIVAFNNTLLRDPDGTITGSLSSGVDMTERREAEQQIAYLAYHDSLTGLPNRALLHEHLELSLARARRTETAVALLYLDLDDFKLVNDSLGHGAGDELLRRVATELRARTRATDLLARQGGDEFLLLLADLTDPAASAEKAAELVQGAFAEPFEIGGTEFHIGASIGISLFPDDALDTEALLAHADAAMYEAKGAGRNEIRRFRDDIGPGIDRLSFTTRLRRAMARDELELHWQPIVDIESGLIAGLEALVRWQDPGRGLVMPAEFVPFAEETGLIDPLGEWVAERFCRQREAWQALGLDPYVGFNVSPRELRRPDFAERLLAVLTARGLDLDHVTIEITEAAVLGGDPQSRMPVDKLSEAGITLALDDFGVAYLSLSRLRDVPARWIKIDRSFLAAAPEDRQATAILGAMVGLVGAVGLELIVEGVERPAQQELLRALGVSKAQGYLLGRPAPAEALEARLRESPRVLAATDIAFDERGLVPCVIQDWNTGEVLTLAYMNAEALERTQATGELHLWSRSRDELWHKGATSGHTQTVRGLRTDCDTDAILALVEPAGPACHTGERTCFFTGDMAPAPHEALPALARTYAQRAAERPEGSYVVSLIDDPALAGEKVQEEAEEVVRAVREEGVERTREETADVLFHLTVAVGGDLTGALEVLNGRRG